MIYILDDIPNRLLGKHVLLGGIEGLTHIATTMVFLAGDFNIEVSEKLWTLPAIKLF